MSETMENRKQQPHAQKDAQPDAQPDEQVEHEGDPRAGHKMAKKRAFLEHLAITSSIKQSADVADIANSTLYLWRDTDPDFAAAWLKALAAGYELLEMEMLERARHGVERKIYYHGKHVATVRDYDHKTGLQLLRLHKESVALVRAARAELAAEPEPVRDTLDEKLKKINVRLRAYQAEKRRKKQAGAAHGDARDDAGDEGGIDSGFDAGFDSGADNGESHAEGEKNGKRVRVIDDA
ncbi:hypothetical protein [Parasphingorhabdus cellanae]|uniref:Terminase n=1 Tax=Parasphingorhabdus cellanae TaxID=2806553 RepID=A0ABX7TAR0_9SPHN|nr:hypothetical protein [Parasphingorhabdus cellanae]QTD57567.1 hypothetical protein J4G78_08630 [Parasphingorhabdus cellanae]